MFLALIFLGQLFLLYFLSKRVNNDILRLLYRITKNEERAVYLYSIIFLPGTFIHEAAHYITALFLFVPVSEMVLIPKSGEKSIRLGEVQIAKVDLVRSTIVGLAPFLWGMSIVSVIIYYGLKLPDPAWYLQVIGVIVVFEIANTMFLSKSDIKSTLKLILLLVITLTVLYFFGVRYSVNLSFLDNTNLQKVLNNLVLFFIIPIALDLGIILIAEVLDKIGKRGYAD